MHITNHQLLGVAQPCRYKHYLATNRLIEKATTGTVPLSIGGHCLVLIDGKALMLKNKIGTIMTPGGMIDFADCQNGELDIVVGIRREIIEEVGFLPHGEIVLTGGFIGGNNTHIFFTAVLISTHTNEDIKSLSNFKEIQSEDILGWELMSVETLLTLTSEISLSAATAARAYVCDKFN